jgi:S1-C subfamily serine protease
MYSQNDPYRQPYYNSSPQAYQYPYSGRQRVALQAYSGPSCAPGSLQVPEIGAEVLPAESAGLLVTRVYKMSHADRDGLLVGDIIIKFAGKRITSPDMFFRAISSASPEAYVKFAVLRSGRAKTLSIMMGKRELDGVIVPPDAAPAHPFAIP